MNDNRVARVADVIESTLDAAVQLLEDRSKSGVSPGLGYAVFAAGGMIAAGGFDNGDDHSAPRPDTAFRIASCTKSFTAAAALILRAKD